MSGELPDGWDTDIPVFPADAKGMARRVAGGKVMNAVVSPLPGLVGGSADLNPSTMTALSGLGDFEPAGMDLCDKQGATDGVWGYAGRNLYFGVREHGMGAILNGLAAHGGTVPFGATFLIFSDYMRPPMRLAAMMRLHVIYVFTHDSIALGRDGSTHQPVEQLAGLRAVPGLTVIRPGDANETAVAWRVALEAGDHPVALVLTRQNVHDDWFPKEPNVGYETLLYDVMIGDPTLFMRADMVEEAWRVVQPVLDAWAKKKADIPDYASGSDGPKAADELIAADGDRAWRPMGAPAKRKP